MTTCILCPPGDHEPALGRIVFEDDSLFVFLHHDWAVQGHAVVVWREHVENLSDLDSESTRHFTSVLHTAERMLLSVTGADRGILLKLGVMVPHLHMHIYPVGRELDRERVMRIIEGKERVERSEDEKAAFAAEVARRMKVQSES